MKSYRPRFRAVCVSAPALIRTLAVDPDVLLLDEPFSALDYQTRLSVCDDVYKIIRSEHKTTVLITHDISEAVSVADKIVVLSRRPARVVSRHTLSFPENEPLKRRENKEFSTWFELLWRELNCMKNKQEYSREHLLYLRKLKRTNATVHIVRLAVLFLFLILWELSAHFEWINPFITSSPSRIWKTLVSLYQNGTLFYHVGTTLWETLLGFFIAVVAGYTIALLLWWSEVFRKISEPYLVVLTPCRKSRWGR